MARNVLSEIHSMRRVLGGFANDVDFTNLEHSALAVLSWIERLIDEGKIAPMAKVRHATEETLFRVAGRELRFGVFPTAADPLHWGHLLGGLITMEHFFLASPKWPRSTFVIACSRLRHSSQAASLRKNSSKVRLQVQVHDIYIVPKLCHQLSVDGEKLLGRDPANCDIDVRPFPDVSSS